MAEKVYRIDIDTSRAENNLNRMIQVARELDKRISELANHNNQPSGVSKVKEEADKLNDILKKTAGVVGTVFTVQKAFEFASQVTNVRGEFQKLEIAFETMLQSKEKANALMAQLVDTAAKTPFDLQGVAGGAKQLLAYGIEAGKVNETLLKLGDIAAGLSLPLGDLVYLYGTTVTQGRVYTRDMIQFMGRGIPLADELAKQFGVTKDKVSELVSAGKVGAEEFTKAIDSMAKGKFNNLMEKQSQSLTGQLSNLQDSIAVMLNEIGKSAEGVLSGSISAVSTLVENYKILGQVLMGIVATYGTYRAALLIANATQAIHILGLKDAIKYLKLLTVETKAGTAAQALFNAVVKANPYVRLATALIAVASAMWIFISNTGKARDVQKEFNASLDDMNKKLEERRNRRQELVQVIKSETATNWQKDEAFEELKTLMPNIKMTLEEIRDMDMSKLGKSLNDTFDKDRLATYKENVDRLKEELNSINIQLDKTIKDRRKASNANNEVEYTNLTRRILSLQQLLTAQKEKLSLAERNLSDATEKYNWSLLSNEEKLAKTNDRLREQKEKFDAVNKAIEMLRKGLKVPAELLIKIGIEPQDELAEKFIKGGGMLNSNERKPMMYQGRQPSIFKTGIPNLDKGLAPLDYTAPSLNQLKTTSSMVGKSIGDLTKQLEELQGKQAKAEIKNKEYWRKQKEEAQAALDALASDKKGSKEWQELIKKIQQADEALKAYNITSKSSSTNTYDRAKAEQKYLENLEENKKRIEDEMRNIEYEREQLSVDLLNDGYEKDLLQIKLNYKKKTEQIEKEEREMVERLRALKLEEYKLNHNGSDKGFDPTKITSSDLSPEERKYLQDKREIADTTKAREDAKVFEEVSDRYKTSAEKISDIREKYSREVEMINKNIVLSEKEKADKIAEIGRTEADEIKHVTDEILERYNLLALYNGNGGSDFIKDEIKKVLPLFEDLSKLSFGQLKDAQKAIRNIKIPDDVLKSLEKAGVDIKKLQEAIEQMKNNTNEQIEVSKFEKLSEIGKDIASSFESVGSTLASLSGTAGTIGRLMQSTGQAINSISGTMKTLTQNGGKMGFGGYASLASSVISGIAEMYGAIKKRQEENIQKQKEYTEALMETQRQARLMAIDDKAYKERNIFGVEDPLSKAKAGLEQYKVAIKEMDTLTQNLYSKGYIKTAQKLVTDWESTGSLALKGAGVGAAAGAIVGSVIPVVGTAIGTAVGAVVGAIGGFFTGLFGSKKTEDKFAKLKGKYSYVYDKETYELNPEILKDYALMDEATKKIIDNWKEIKQRAEEAKKAIEDNVKALTGDLGNKLMDALMKGFRNNNIKSAMQDFKKDMNQIIQDLALQKAFAAVFGDIFDNLSNELKDSLSIGGDGDIVDDLSRGYDAINKRSEIWIKVVEKINEVLSAKGHGEIAKIDDKRSSVAKGIAQASEDSINELTGLAHQSVILQDRIAKAAEALNLDRLTDLQYKGWQEVAIIRHLTESINQSTTSMNSTLSDIRTKGIYIKR